MIKRIVVKNCERHRDLAVALERVTTIVGPNDAGKSALLRAIRWVCQNNRRGDKFIRKGSKTASATLEVGKHSVKRVKGKGNYYLVDGRKLEAFGAKVPDQVSAILNVGDLNFQPQVDSTFWFSKSAGEVSRALNKIVDLEVIDTTLANLSRGLRSAQSELNVVGDRAKRARKELKRLRPAEDCASDLAELLELKRKAKIGADGRRSLARAVGKAVKYQGRCRKAEEASAQADAALKRGTAWLRSRARAQTLGKLAATAPRARSVPLPDESLFKKWTSLLHERGILRELLKENDRCEKQRRENTFGVSVINTKLKRFKVCPLCGK